MTSLHAIDRPPLVLNTNLCPHGRHVSRVCEVCDPPSPYYGNDRLIQEFLVREEGDGTALQCICGNASFKRQLWERWTKTESVDLSNASLDGPDSTAEVSSGEYDDDDDSDPWECDSCGTHVPRRSHLWDLLEELDKEPY